jgi:hypothetical protein
MYLAIIYNYAKEEKTTLQSKITNLMLYLIFILDNAYDPDVSASELWIDKRNINKKECLTFVDNGNGMNQEKLYKMLRYMSLII